ncbi:MAG: TonB-dependent receptor [Cellvibrionales bacterium TMED148]|nr:TonB-dependent receptor [Porticoccaceae bacterium]RPG88737.1 MAG: TonB-dependent receptor [Cellvibrionales bacterium TMED148]
MIRFYDVLNTSKLLSLVLTLSYSALGFSQNVLEEVVVTAQKREQNIQDVPIAITAFTGAQMEALGVSESFDIAAFTPGVHISGNLAGQNTQFTIRGVTQNDFNDIIEAPTAIYLDDGYIAVSQGQTFSVFDIERAEILKGPQGTLFGRNATGGLVHYQSVKPSFDEFSGYASFELGQYDSDADAIRTVFEGAAGGPLSEKLAGRIAVRYSKQDGYLKNLFPADSAVGLGARPPGPTSGADLGDDDTKAARISLAFEPSENLSVAFSANYAKSELATGPYQSKSTIGVLDELGELINVIDTPANETRLSIAADGSDGGGTILGGNYPLIPGGGIGLPGRPTPGGDFFGYLDPDGDDFTFSGDFAHEDQGFTESTGFGIRFYYTLSNGVEFTSITDRKEFEKLLFIDVDAAPINQTANYAAVDATTFTQEFRLNGEGDRSRWVAGLYYLSIENESDNGLKAPANSIIDDAFTGGLGGGLAAIDIGATGDLDTDSYSVFAQYEYDLSEEFIVIVGARAMKEEKEYSYSNGLFPSFDSFSVNQGNYIPNLFGAGTPYYYTNESSENFWAGNLQLQWQKSDDLMIYAGLKRGVKAGSYNMPLFGGYLAFGGDEGLPYDKEILYSYEAGFKASLGDTTRINGTVYFYDYKDYQAFLFVDVGGGVINRDAETIGAELEMQSSPNENLDLILGLSVLDSEIKQVPLRVGSPLAPLDVKPNYTPEVQATALARYNWPAFNGNMAIQGDITYSDEYYYNLRNYDADKFDSYVMVNASLTWLSADEKLSGKLSIKNLTDERAGIQGFDLAIFCGCNEVSYRPPTYYSLSVKREF